MKLSKKTSAKEINSDNMISELLTLESNDLIKKRKRKSTSHVITNEGTSPNIISESLELESSGLTKKKKRKSTSHEITSEETNPNIISELLELEISGLTKKKKRKSTSHQITNEETNPNIISKLLELGSNGLTKKKKRKSTSHNILNEGTNPNISELLELENNDLAKRRRRKSTSGETSPKKAKLGNKYAGTVPKPIKSKFGSFQNEDSNSDECNELPAPILIKKEEKSLHKREVKVPMPIKVTEKDFKSSLKKDIPLTKRELDTDTDDEEDQSLLRDDSLISGAQKHIEQSSDSESSRDEKPNSEKDSNWIRTLQKENPKLTRQVVDLSPPRLHAKYSLIRVPKNVSPTLLRNLKCRFDKEVLNSKQQYRFQPLTKKPGPVFINLNGPRLVNLDTVIVLQKSSPALPVHHIKVVKRENVSLPDAVKERHPLFGVAYKKKIKVEREIKRKILEAIEGKREVEQQDKKKKEKRKRNKAKRNRHSVAKDEETLLDLLNLQTLRKSR